MTSATDPVERFREVMSAVPAAVAVLTLVDDDGEPRGMTISSLASVSADPPSVMFGIGPNASMKATFVPGRDLCINLLSGDQAGHSVGFAYGEERPFEVFEWSPAENGAPLLAGCASHLLGQVKRVEVHHGTSIVLTDVTGGDVHTDDALVYWHRAYFGGLVPVEGTEPGKW